MKNPLPLIAITIITQVSMAQNVGIGVTVPSAKLQILQTGTTPGLRVAIENPASVTPGLFVVSNSQGGPVEAINTATTGVINGVAGVVSSSSAGTITSGVSGVLGISQATSSGALSAGVRGINYSSNTSGVGVVGYHAGAGVGVFGEGGTGVYGFGHGANARGVRGLVSDANAIGILAEYGEAGF